MKPSTYIMDFYSHRNLYDMARRHDETWLNSEVIVSPVTEAEMKVFEQIKKQLKYEKFMKSIGGDRRTV